MKKILFSLVALVCSMSMNAQVMKVMKGNVVVATYTAEQADNVVFEEAPASTTTGTAKATIGGSEVDVNWVQLWADGPKFADRNVESTMTFTQATADPFVWGANWCTPSKADMDELLKAATSAGSTKVKCDYVNVSGIYGFKFTGKETGYTENSVFFPTRGEGWASYGGVNYWSGTASGTYGWGMRLSYDGDSEGEGGWYSRWAEDPQTNVKSVRPVLK